LNVPEYVTAM